MTILSKLNLSDKTKAAMLTSPEAKLWGKMLGAPDLQIEAAKATLNGETFIRWPWAGWMTPRPASVSASNTGVSRGRRGFYRGIGTRPERTKRKKRA